MLADLHLHTKYSACSSNEPEEVLKRSKHLDGVAVTDHNTIEGALAVKKLNKNPDFTVIIGSEISTNYGEILGYNLNEKISSYDVFEAIDLVHSQGGIVSVPHPFDIIRKEAMGSKNLQEIARKVDMIEGINGRCNWLYNRRAIKFAEKNKIPAAGGSDAHFPREIGRVYTEFEKLEKPLRIYGNTNVAFLYYLVKSKRLKRSRK